MKKTIGILGGMGPEATAYFFKLIIKNTKAEKDQEHIPVVIYSHPEVPPRTDAVLGSAADRCCAGGRTESPTLSS